LRQTDPCAASGPIGLADARSCARARAYAFLLLKFRPRSCAELAERLKKKKFDQAVIEQTVSFLRAKRFIDDEAFARAWAESRVRKPLGLARIRQELFKKGISRDITASVLSDVGARFPESEAIRELARRKFEKSKDADARAAARRIGASLIRRGFSPDAVWDIVSELCKRTS